MALDGVLGFLWLFLGDAWTPSRNGSETTAGLSVLACIDGLFSNRFLLLFVWAEELRKIGQRGCERVIHEGMTREDEWILVDGSI